MFDKDRLKEAAGKRPWLMVVVVGGFVGLLAVVLILSLG